ncbi:Bug family tripartite tricarboxylate transporter substrate binding protein [Arthrobacter sp. NIO-1057]|uniref:Bug family tripartite tricarboxylate transporter substrate binding protein n=1 Tax=Arthrobacter sp. NIO-1057 TaxID=993071 RepID=UPI00071C7AE8|nr:tripartite tricarboxylate transporter substrate-binding protein [Arthrobacter sp. NIO-1057]KSU66676.1 tricarboxylic transporter [Arthrobacter sp. NIO-1057]SCC20925.1 putative tricarboxylic transport membrane protein [Arthrobacter sp. NIO-1057]
MKWTKRGALLGVALIVALPIAISDAASSDGTGGPRASLTLLVPGSAGGGYDSLARESQQALRSNGISGNIQVVNVPGASGTLGLEKIIEMQGQDNVALVVGSAMVGGVEITGSDATLDGVTPLLSLTTDFPVFALPSDSPYDNIDEFVAAWKKDPQGFPIGGGALGNIDHLAALQFAQAVGIDPKEVNYIAYSGGGEVLGAMLSNTVKVGVSGFSEIADQLEAGTVKPLAVASPADGPDFGMPSFASLGYDVVVPNWRGLVAPPGITDEQRNDLISMVEEMRHTEEWQQALDRQQWDEDVRTGDKFSEFIDDDIERTQDLLEGTL